MLRTVLLTVLLGIIVCAVGGAVYISRLRDEAIAPLRHGYRPPASAMSSAFTDALWSQVERSRPVVVDTSVSATSLLFAAATKTARDSRGFLLASVAAHSLALSQAHEPQIAAQGLPSIARELLRAHALLTYASLDELAAIYAATAPFGGSIIGIEAAASQFFGKPAALLDATEAATLVVVSWTPNRCDTMRLRDRRNALLTVMQSLGLAPIEPPAAELGIPALVLGSLCVR